MTGDACVEASGVLETGGRRLDLGGFSVQRGGVCLVEGECAPVLFSGFLPPAKSCIRVLGAEAGGVEARAVTAIAARDLPVITGLTVLEHLLLAVRLGGPRVRGSGLDFSATLAVVGLAAGEEVLASTLAPRDRFRLSLAMMMVRPVPLWVAGAWGEEIGPAAVEVLRRHASDGGAVIVAGWSGQLRPAIRLLAAGGRVRAVT